MGKVSRKSYLTFVLACGVGWLTLMTNTTMAAENSRLEELERKIEAQQALLQELTSQMQALKQESQASANKAAKAKRIADDVSMEVFGMPIVTSDDPRFKVKLGGRIHRAVKYAADGHKGKFYHTDSGNLPTILNVIAQGKVSEDLTVGAQWETQFADNSPVSVNQNNENSGLDVAGRIYSVFFDSKRFGKLDVGKGWASSFTIYETDLSGTQTGMILSPGTTFAGLLFWNRDDNKFTNIRVGEVFLDVENASLVNRIRYDSPQFYGFQLSGSWGADQRSDVTLRWKDEIGGFQFSGATSYQRNTFGFRANWRADGILGILHKPTGLSLVGGAATSEKKGEGDRNATGWIAKLGWRKKWFGFGETKLAVDFNRNSDTLTDQENSTAYGAFWVQDVDKWGMELYAGYRYYDYDRKDFDTAPIHVPLIGTYKTF